MQALCGLQGLTVMGGDAGRFPQPFIISPALEFACSSLCKLQKFLPLLTFRLTPKSSAASDSCHGGRERARGQFQAEHRHRLRHQGLCVSRTCSTWKLPDVEEIAVKTWRTPPSRSLRTPAPQSGGGGPKGREPWLEPPFLFHRAAAALSPAPSRNRGPLWP